MELKIVLNNALNTLLKNYFKTIGIYLGYIFSILVINFLFYLIGSIIGNFILIFILSIVSAIITIGLQVGLIKQFILVYNEKEVRISDLFNFAEKYLKSSLVIWLSLGVKCTIPCLIALIPYGSIVSCVWLTIIGFKYFYAYNELIHSDVSSAQLILMNTENIMYGNKLKLFFLIVISFVLIALVNFIFKGFGIALTIFLLMPLMNYIIIGFYEEARVSYNVMQKMAHTKIIDY